MMTYFGDHTFLLITSLFLCPLLELSDAMVCAKGRFGPSCESECSRYCKGACDPQHGVCVDGCVSGRYGFRCHRRCRRYRYGPNCVHACGHCLSDQSCDRVTGVCPSKCVSGWIGSRCDKGCAPFSYGDQCKFTCGECKYGKPCNQVTGVCSGGCKPGWYGQNCDTKCNSGKHGVDCSLTCQNCHGNETCHHITGKCINGCSHGWSGDKCDQACPSGTYGSSCALKCGSCRNGSCHHVDGRCTGGCVPGWVGRTCTSACRRGSYGVNCTARCGHCEGGRECHPATGVCTDGCVGGWSGDQCKTVSFTSADTRISGSHVILPGLVVTLVVITSLLLFAIFYHMRMRQNRATTRRRLVALVESHPESEERVGDCINTYEPLIRTNHFGLDKSNFHLSNDLLGYGHFGKVIRGHVTKNDTKMCVAVKSLKENASDTDRSDFLNEVQILKKVGWHQNVICLVGSCHIDGVLHVALEYASNGDLRTYLRRSRLTNQQTYTNMTTTSSLSQNTLLQFGLDTARGMAHLAYKKIIHRDLAARNVLLDERLVAKVADFGMSRNDDTYVKTSLSRVPVRWMAIESLFNSTYSTKSDVWSFGVLLWEVVSLGGTPYPGIDAKRLFSLLHEGHRMSQPSGCAQVLFDLMLQCWAENPNDRPDFHRLCETLTKMTNTSQVYVNVEIDDDSQYSLIDADGEDNTWCMTSQDMR